MIYESPKDDSPFFFSLLPWKVYGNFLLHVQSSTGDFKCIVGFSLLLLLYDAVPWSVGGLLAHMILWGFD